MISRFASCFMREKAGSSARLRTDSRRIRRGDIFFAFPGDTDDGRRHIVDAIARGAAAILWESEGFVWDRVWKCPALGVPSLRAASGKLADLHFNRPSARLRIIAVTGTNGKTTVAWWCAKLLEAAGLPAGYVGTVGAFAAGRELDMPELTTPCAAEMHGLLARISGMGCEAAAVEASSHALAQDRLDAVDCNVAVLTGIGRDHHDYHGDEKSYLASKRLLFERKELRAAVVNADDRHAASFADAASCRVVKVGRRRSDIVWRRTGISPGGGQRARISGDFGDFDFELSSPGEFNIANAALAFAAVSHAGADSEAVASALGSLEPPTGRMQRVPGRGAAVYVDYAHTPESLALAVDAVREAHPRARLVCVFGCGGNRDRGKRRGMGAAASAADLVVITTDNPREEDPRQIAEDAAAGVGAEMISITDRGQAIREAVRKAGPDGAVLVAGKGHERYIAGANGSRVCFSDADAAREALAEFR